MSEPITQAEADEISAYCETHPNCRIQILGDDHLWCIYISDAKDFRCWMHPRSFLDVIRETPVIDILKTT